MAPSKYKQCHFYGLQKICLQTKFELSKWTLALSGPVFAFRSLNKVPQQMALSKNKPRHAFRNAKIYFFAKFRQNIPTFRTKIIRKTANGGEPNALHVSYQRPSKREPPRFARRLKKALAWDRTTMIWMILDLENTTDWILGAAGINICKLHYFANQLCKRCLMTS